MKVVDLKQMPELFRGCIAPGRRMSDELLELFSYREPTLWRAQCASGVRLDFITDAAAIEYSLEFGKPVRQIFTSDIFVDGELQTVNGAGPHILEFSPGKKHIVIHLPHLVVLENITLKISKDAEIEAAPAAEKRLLFCGDSIMQGMVSTTPSAALAPQIAAALEMDFINTSVGGARMNPKHLKYTMTAQGDILILALGVNDALQKMPYDEFRAVCEEVLAEMSAFAGPKVVVLPIPNTAPSTPDLPVYREIIRFAAMQYPEIVISDGYDYFPAEPELFFDRTHPNDAGFAIYARHLTGLLKSLL